MPCNQVASTRSEFFDAVLTSMLYICTPQIVKSGENVVSLSHSVSSVSRDISSR